MVGYSGHNRHDSASTMIGMVIVDSPEPRLIPAQDAAFPRSLADLPVPPSGLWTAGRLPRPGERMLSVVGSRSVSQSACARVAELTGHLARAGWSIVSGGALGIDAAAHRGALSAGGSTFAVLGCGIDVVYPDRHRDLFRHITARGGLLSEYGPGCPPHRGQFPVRNRIVAALGRFLLVGESRGGSGALITARIAAQLGRPLLAIPGSGGTDRLIASGAAVAVTSTDDLDGALAGRRRAQGSVAPGPWAAVLGLLKQGPATAEEIADRADKSVGEVLSLLGAAELAGLVERRPGGTFEVHRGN